MGTFVGRALEVAELERGLDALFAKRGGLFLLSGEPGIGKTRLADHVCERARSRGAEIAWGAAWDGGGAPAYWPWTQVLRALRPRLPEPDEALKRELGPMWDPGAEEQCAPGDLEVERFRRFDALRAVLQVAAQDPVIVVLDDLHAADRASLLALHFIARALRSLPIMIVGTQRDALEPEVADLLAKIAREGRVLRLHPFDKPEMVQLLAKYDPVSPLLVDELLRTTGGNPLLIDETLRLVRSGQRPNDLYASASAVIRDRIDRLDPDLRELLEAAAVLGRELSLGLLAEVLSLEPGKLEAKLRAPQLSGIVAKNGDTLRFCHALFREELYRGLSAPRKRALHLAAGTLLAEPEELIARHLLAAQPEGDPAVAGEHAMRAGEAAMRSLAFDRAAAFFEGAVQAFDRLPEDRPRRIDVRLRLAEALARAGYVDRGRAVCLEAAEDARAIRDGERLANAALIYGAQLRIANVDRTLIELLEASLALLGDRMPALRARVLARLAAAEQPSPDPMGPVEKARSAIQLARTVGDPETLLATIYSAGSALVDYAPAEERRALAEELIALALPRGELALAQQGYARMTMDSLELCDFATADVAITAHERLGRALGHPRWWWRSAVMRSMRALIDGRWSDSEAALEEANRFAQQADDPNAALTIAIHSIGALRVREAGTPGDLLSAWNVAIDSVEYGVLVGAAVRASVLGRFGDVEPARALLSSFKLEPVHHDPMALTLVADAIDVAGDRAWAKTALPALEPFRGRALSWGVFGMIWDGPVEQLIGALLLVQERWKRRRRSSRLRSPVPMRSQPGRSRRASRGSSRMRRRGSETVSERVN